MIGTLSTIIWRTEQDGSNYRTAGEEVENFMKDEVEIAAWNLKRRKSGANNISADMVEAGGKAWWT